MAEVWTCPDGFFFYFYSIYPCLKLACLISLTTKCELSFSWYLMTRHIFFRYLCVRWGVDLSKMVVFVGECGDTDSEGLLGGLHKSVILKGTCGSAINQLHANRSDPLSDVMPSDSPNIVQTTEECGSDDIRASLEKLGL
jgi:sucrose-phosphate synthase